jgi:hypothetical protein
MYEWHAQWKPLLHLWGIVPTTNNIQQHLAHFTTYKYYSPAVYLHILSDSNNRDFHSLHNQE